jgi:hypothetical protein
MRGQHYQKPPSQNLRGLGALDIYMNLGAVSKSKYIALWVKKGG